jgi:hypothetical protein
MSGIIDLSICHCLFFLYALKLLHAKPRIHRRRFHKLFDTD